MARTFSPAEYVGSLEASIRTPESAAPVLGAALVASESLNQLGWTSDPVLIANLDALASLLATLPVAAPSAGGPWLNNGIIQFAPAGPGLLDGVEATVASSFRKLYTQQTQYAVVRNASYADLVVGFDGKWVDGQALIKHADGGDLWLKKLIDASGNENHLTQLSPQYQPKILSSGLPFLSNYAASISYDGVDDILNSAILSWGDTLTALIAVHSLTGGDKVAMCSGNTTALSQSNWYAPLTQGNGYPVVGTTGLVAGAYNLYERSSLSGRAGIGGVFANGETLPILNAIASTSGWNRSYSGSYTSFTNNPMHVGGDTRAGVFSTLKHAGLAVFPQVLSGGDLLRAGVALGFAASGVMIGDSTVAAYGDADEVASFVMRGADCFRSHGIRSIAVPGETIAQQTAAWQALTTRALAEWVSIQVGLNDCDPSDSTTAAKIAALQNLINMIRADNPGCKLVGATMTPAYLRWGDLGWNAAQAQARWVAFNDAVMGRGASALTGLDASTEEHTLAMTMEVDGNAALATWADSGDRIHPNNAARALNGAAIRAALGSLGFY